METHLVTNWIPLGVLLPILIIVSAGIVWLIAKANVVLWKRATLSVGGFFAIFGFAIALFIVYYHISTVFSDTFKFYAYSTFAPAGDPFEKLNSNQRVVMMREVANNDGEVSLLYHPNPEVATVVYLFTPGKYITADLKDDVLTIPEVDADDLPRVINTSLWWALTKNIYNVVSSVK